MQALRQQSGRVDELGLSLVGPQLRDPGDRATVLHAALRQGRWNVAAHLIRSTTDDRLLDEVYDVTGRLRLTDYRQDIAIVIRPSVRLFVSTLSCEPTDI